MELTQIVDDQTILEIKEKIRSKAIDFYGLNKGSKAKAADQIFTNYLILQELGRAAVDTIEQMDEEIELKDNKINALEEELKNLGEFDETKIQDALNKNPVIRNENRERAKNRLIKTLTAIKD